MFFLTNSAALAGFTLTNGAGLQIYFIVFQGASIPVFARLGGGVWSASIGSVVSNCVITGNGGGAFGGTLENCSLLGNVEAGAVQCALNNCLLVDNTESGAFDSRLNNCTLKGNSAREGGGARYSTLNNCLLIGNVAIREDGDGGGGGAFHCWLTNCTLIGNCIAYFNTDLQGIGPNYVACTLNSSCTTPLPVDGQPHERTCVS